MLVLARHARAGDRHHWSGDDRMRPLDRTGERQAEGLADQLDGVALKRVLTSPARRCLQTVEPLARARQLPIEVDERLWEGDPDPAIELVLSLADDDAILCSHGDIIPAVLSHLARHHGLDLGPHPHCQKGSAWLLTAQEGSFVTAAYRAPTTP